ncbi:MAG: hypothetical protein GY852_00205, partial [bacterium]|nr:hypothetical protein [bacterium]
MKVDGANSGSSPSGYAAAINNRLAVPSDIEISVNMVGNASGGTAYVSVTAEAAPASGTIKVWNVILEDHEIASSSWGGYNGQEMMWIPVATPLGSNGSVLNFTGPYPQTLEVSGAYTLSPSSHIFDNLNVATYVQHTTGSKEVLNASFIDLPDTGSSGVYSDEGVSVVSSAVLSAWPNPTTGAFSVSSFVPQGTSGTVDIFDITGRSVDQFTAGSVQNMNIEDA